MILITEILFRYDISNTNLYWILLNYLHQHANLLERDFLSMARNIMTSYTFVGTQIDGCYLKEIIGDKNKPVLYIYTSTWNRRGS